jgi:hypothetical protein
LIPRAPTQRSRELIALALALCSVLLGLLPLKAFDLLQIGRQHASEAPALKISQLTRALPGDITMIFGDDALVPR